MSIGYTKVPHELARDTSLSATAKLAWIIIAGTSEGYEPTISAFAKMANCSVSVWRRAVHELEQRGMVTANRSANHICYHTVDSPSEWAQGVKSDSLQGVKSDSVGCQKRYPEGIKSDSLRVSNLIPIRRTIEEQENNLGVRARMREEVMTDMMVEIGCRSVGITPDQYHQLATLIFSDWEFQDLPDSEWTKQHFLGVLRIKAKELRNGTTIRQPIAAGRQQRAEAIARAMAALGTQGCQTQELPY